MLEEHIQLDDVANRMRPLIGRVHRSLGYVKLQRRHFPNDGVLYETEHGLFFLPHRVVQTAQLVEEQAASPLWRVAAAIWAPLWFVLPFVKTKRVKTKLVEETEPIRLLGDDLQRLSELLPRLPGAFFLAAKDIATVRTKKRVWVIERFTGSKLMIEPLTTDVFGERMEQLRNKDHWRMAMGQT